MAIRLDKPAKNQPRYCVVWVKNSMAKQAAGMRQNQSELSGSLA